jgi:hypothetical protein
VSRRLASGAVPAAAAVLIALAAGAPFALGGKKLKTRSSTTTIAAGEGGAATATCKRGAKAVSGGFETEFFGVDTNFPFIPAESSRRSGPREWTSSGYNNGNGEGDLTSFAYCRAQKIKSTSATVTIPVGQFETATATCPRGTRVISGGFEADPIIPGGGDTPVLRVSESQKVGNRSWEASAFSNGNLEGDLTAYVYCRDGKRLKTKQASATLTQKTPDMDFKDIEARCKRKQRVVSGGFTSPPVEAEATPRILSSRRVGKRSWGVAAFIGGTGATIDFTAYAYCEKRR